MYYSLLIFPELNHFNTNSKKSTRSLKKMSPRKRIKKSRRKSCLHTKNFSCYHSEQTTFVNGKKQHKKQNLCKCYDCGMEF